MTLNSWPRFGLWSNRELSWLPLDTLWIAFNEMLEPGPITCGSHSLDEPDQSCRQWSILNDQSWVHTRWHTLYQSHCTNQVKGRTSHDCAIYSIERGLLYILLFWKSIAIISFFGSLLHLLLPEIAGQDMVGWSWSKQLSRRDWRTGNLFPIHVLALLYSKFAIPITSGL